MARIGAVRLLAAIVVLVMCAGCDQQAAKERRARVGAPETPQVFVAPEAQAKGKSIARPFPAELQSPRPGQYDSISLENAGQLARNIPVHFSFNAGHPPVVDQWAETARTLTQGLLEACALGDFTILEAHPTPYSMDVINSPEHLLSTVQLDRAESPNYHWQGVNTAASGIWIVGVSAQEIAAAPALFDSIGEFLPVQRANGFGPVAVAIIDLGVEHEGPGKNTCAYGFLIDTKGQFYFSHGQSSNQMARVP